MRRLLPRRPLAASPTSSSSGRPRRSAASAPQSRGLALPLVAVIVLDVSAFEVALLGVIEFPPFILFTLPAGVWVDRLRRKPILVVGDLGRAVLLASIPLAYALDALTIWQLYVVGFVVGICTVFFDVAYQSYLPSLVERDQLVEGNSKLEISRSAAQIAGPGSPARMIARLTRARRRPPRRDQLRRLGALPRSRSGSRRAAAPTRAERQAGPEHEGGSSRGPALRARQPLPARDLGLHRDVRTSSGSIIVLDLPRLRRPRARPRSAARSGSSSRSANFGYLVGALSANKISGAPRRRADDHHGAAFLGLTAACSPLAPASNPIPFLVAAQAISSWASRSTTSRRSASGRRSAASGCRAG